MNTKTLANRNHFEREKGLTDLVIKKHLGLESSQSEGRTFSPCAISLVPWKMEKELFYKAVDVSKALSRLLTAAANNREFLYLALADYHDEESLLYQFKMIFEAQLNQSNLAVKSTNFNITRYDYLLNQSNNWKLVESNAIAAGMGPFSEKLEELHREFFSQNSVNYAPNSAISLQAESMYQAAKDLNGENEPNIIFVVDEEEDNIFDQHFLSEQLEKYGARVFYRTFNDLALTLTSKSNSLYLSEHYKVNLVYFRTGYNLSDYKSINNKSNFYPFIQLRQWIEQHEVVVCPNIAHQVASSKWIQIKLSQLSSSEMGKLFQLSQQEIELTRSALQCQYLSIGSVIQVKQLLKGKRWLLKNQNEGGGNVFASPQNLPHINDLKSSYFLMEKIDAQERVNIEILMKDQLSFVLKVISELGIFIVGNEHQYAGYLMRSKSSDKTEAGVHGGFGFLDLVTLA